MNQQKSKKYRKLFTEQMKDQSKEAMEKLVTDHVQRKINQLKFDEWRTARQRDWFILLSTGLAVSNIVFIILWRIS
jgi:hypothetical protein